MASSESRKRKAEEYEMQLFGFHSRAVYATLRSIVYERIQSKIQKLCETIEKSHDPSSEKLEILKGDKKRLIKAYCKAAKPHFINIETAVNKYISIPNNVLLEEDKDQRTQYSSVEFANLQQNLEDLQQRAKRATILNAALKEELQTMQSFIDFEDRAKKMCNIIEEAFACSSMSSDTISLVTEYKKLVTSINSATKKTLKSMYNMSNNIKCTELDLSSL